MDEVKEELADLAVDMASRVLRFDEQTRRNILLGTGTKTGSRKGVLKLAAPCDNKELLSLIHILIMTTGMIAIAAALALLPCAFAGLGMGLATGKAADATARQPEASGKISASLMMGLALTESCAIYGFVTALIIIFTMA